jgi:uncharacterized protein (DUF885 family)
LATVFEIAHDYVEAFAALDPYGATLKGIPGHDAEATDYSPDGATARADLHRRTLQALATAPIESEHERIARDVMRERLQAYRDAHDAGEHLQYLRILFNPSASPRRVFDQMPRGSEEDWEAINRRLHLLPGSLSSYRAALDEGRRQGKLAALRQATAVAEQADTWGGRQAAGASFFHRIVDSYPQPDSTLGRQLAAGADRAAAAYLDFADYLRTTYAPHAPEHDGVGAERYQLASRESNGIELDLAETYAWGWEELHRVEGEIRKTAERVLPGADLQAVWRLLATDPARCIDGSDPFRAWLQDLHDRALDALDGVHFDIPPQIRRIEVMIPPPGGELAASYTPPAEDFSRPGRTWWPTGSATVFPRWDRVTTVYHEGVPGHHLEMGNARCLGDRLSRFQKTLAWTSGYGEGWALYAERLMGELGYLEDPDSYLGLLAAQALRCVRVIVDIGMHLGLRIPPGERFHPGEVWSHDLAVEFTSERTNLGEAFIRSEIVRYLGWPAQAISYKVGERVWLGAREATRRRLGPAFDLKGFHTAALNLGPVSLGVLQPEIERAMSN